MGAAWRAPGCPACAKPLAGSEVQDAFYCRGCRTPPSANATAATWWGIGAGVAVCLAAVVLVASGGWVAIWVALEAGTLAALVVGMTAYRWRLLIVRKRRFANLRTGIV